MEHRYARRTASTATARQGDLYEAVRTRDLPGLIQLYADGVELTDPFLEAGQVRRITSQIGERAPRFRLGQICL